MRPSEIKNLIISSLNPDTDAAEPSMILRDEGITFDFHNGFEEKVLGRLFTTVLTINRQVDFAKSMNFAFSRIAFTGVAAIVIMLISIFLMEGSLSFDSFLGLNDSYDESIVCLLTGN